MLNALLFKLNSILLAADDDLPSLDNGAKSWIKNEAGTAVVVVVAVLVVVFLIRQSWGRLLGTIVVGGVVFFIIGDTEATLDTIGNIAKSIIGG